LKDSVVNVTGVAKGTTSFTIYDGGKDSSQNKESSQVVSVTVGQIESNIRAAHYQAGEDKFLTSKEITPDGGVIEGAKDSPIKDVKVFFPAGAVPVNTNYTLAYNDGIMNPVYDKPSGITIDLYPTNIDQRGVAIRSDGSNARIFELPIEITIPYAASDNSDFVIPYYINSNGDLQLVDIKEINPQTKTITFLTFHCSLFSWFIPTAYTNEDHFFTSYRPQADGFQIGNNGSVISSGGECLGMTSFSLWYYIYVKNRSLGGDFYPRFMDSLAQDSKGKALTGQDIIATRSFISIDQNFLNGYYENLINKYTKSDEYTIKIITRSIKETGNPVMIHLESPQTQSAHAVLCYGFTELGAGDYVLSIYDPNYPGDGTKEIKYNSTTKKIDTYSGFSVFYYSGGGSLIVTEDFENILDDAVHNFNKSNLASIEITSHTNGQNVSDETVQISGVIESSQVLVEKLYVSVNKANLFSTSVGADGKFKLDIKLQNGVNILNFVCTGRIFNGSLVQIISNMDKIDFSINRISNNENNKLSTLSGTVQNAASLGKLSDVKVSVFKDNSLIKQTTTDSNGIYSLNIPAGSGYYVTFEKTGYISTKYDNVEVPEYMTTYLEAVLQVSNDNAGRGDVEGIIKSALERDKGVADLTLNFRQGINVKTGNVIATTKTGINGSYTVTNLEAGNYTVEISGNGYQTNYFTAVCLGGKKNSGQNGTVTPILSAGETRIVLTWGASPNDLDSHLVGPASSGNFHIYYSNKTYANNNIKYSDLDLDDVTSYGPETTTIYHQTEGTYRFYIHDLSNCQLSNSNALANSGAQVKVYRGDKVLTFNVPTNLSGTLWTLFELNGDTIKPINTMSYHYEPEYVGTGQSLPPTPTPTPTTTPAGNDYPVVYRDATCADCLAVCCASDRWGFCIKNGTSYVAWRMNRDGGEGSFSNTMRNGHWGNADNWDQNAAQLGITVNNIPVQGAVAQWNKDEIDVQHLKDYGHVAYVESVNSNGTVNISEYNYNRCGYGERSNVSAPRYIHINH